MRFKFKVNGQFSADTFATREAALLAGILKAGGVIAGVGTVGVRHG